MPQDEILDIVDENDNVVGKAPRSVLHKSPNLIHHTVQFTIYVPDTKKILLTQRSTKKEYDGGKICFLGEHIQSEESYVDALTRGVKEELDDFVFDKNKAIEISKNIFSYQYQKELVRFYVLIIPNELSFKYDPDEMDSVFWENLDGIKTAHWNYSHMTRYWIDNANWNLLK